MGVLFVASFFHLVGGFSLCLLQHHFSMPTGFFVNQIFPIAILGLIYKGCVAGSSYLSSAKEAAILHLGFGFG
jgi:vacuolar-type H+-ATPase subunit I/STV1